jgi:hypothetical protein
VSKPEVWGPRQLGMACSLQSISAAGVRGCGVIPVALSLSPPSRSPVPSVAPSPLSQALFSQSVWTTISRPSCPSPPPSNWCWQVVSWAIRPHYDERQISGTGRRIAYYPTSLLLARCIYHTVPPQGRFEFGHVKPPKDSYGTRLHKNQ